MNIVPLESRQARLLRPGNLLAGRFRLVRQLGEGGIGLVWLADDTLLNDEPVACKVLREELRGRRDTVADLKREVLLARKLRHPNVLALQTFWETDDAIFLTMEYIDGASLAEALDSRGTFFSVNEALPWLYDVAHALDFAHKHGILHRDVKPANMLLGSDGAVKLGDFGIARLGHGIDPDEGPTTTQGTVYFMSPEQIANGPSDPRSDLYSLAASAYQLLSGTPPFHEGEILAQIQVRLPAPVPVLSEAVNRELLRALNKSPHKRHGSCREFVEAIEWAADSSIVASRRPPETMRVPANAPTVVLGDYCVETRRTRLGRLLVESGLISQEQLAESLMQQHQSGGKLGAVLVQNRSIAAEDLASALSHQLCTSLTRLPDAEIDPIVARVVGRDLAERFLAVPMKRSPYAVVVAMADPLDTEALNRLEETFGANIEPLVATESDIRAAIERIYVVR